MAAGVRILPTNEFVGSSFPQPTSYAWAFRRRASGARRRRDRTVAALDAALGPDAAIAGRRRGGTLALAPHAAAAALPAADWHPIEATWRDGLMEAVSR
jgi:hypothetical protein